MTADGRAGGSRPAILQAFARNSTLGSGSASAVTSSNLEDSVKQTVGVSKDLRVGVRLSIEIIANDVVRRRQALGLDLQIHLFEFFEMA